jgi:hypothetical protein
VGSLRAALQWVTIRRTIGVHLGDNGGKIPILGPAILQAAQQIVYLAAAAGPQQKFKDLHVQRFVGCDLIQRTTETELNRLAQFVPVEEGEDYLLCALQLGAVKRHGDLGDNVGDDD